MQPCVLHVLSLRRIEQPPWFCHHLKQSSSQHARTCKSVSPSSKQGFLKSKEHVASQQLFKKLFTLQERTLRAVIIPLLLFLFAGFWLVSLHFHFFRDWGNPAPRTSEILYRIFHRACVLWKSSFLRGNYISQTKDRAVWQMKICYYSLENLPFMSVCIMNWQAGDCSSSQIK